MPAFRIVRTMKNIDVVYILKNGIKGNEDELIHSIRSVVENWTFRRLWFVGGEPGGLIPDGAIYHEQTGATRYERVRSSMERVNECDDISDDYFLFNDDFFIMRKITEWNPLYKGTIEEHADKLLQRYVGGSKYEKQIRFSGELLKQRGYSTKNYSLHVPFMVNKEKSEQVFREFPSSAMFKNLYGNVHNIGGIEVDRDTKIHYLHEHARKDQAVVSTNDSTFRHGYIGRDLRERFPEVCRYERGTK